MDRPAPPASTHPADWDPAADEVRRDPRAAYDALRERCPVAWSERHGWTLFRHADVTRALLDPGTFSSVVSAHHPSVPNGMDPPEHTAYRRIVDGYFRVEAVQAFEPACRAIADRLAAPLRQRGRVEFIGQFAGEFAARAQCAFLGWPEDLHAPLREWTRRNDASRLHGDRAEAAALAREFEGHARAMIAARRAAGAAGDDVTSRLLRERIGDRALHDGELVSVLRNWTVGEMGTIAASVGILAHFLGTHADLHARLRGDPGLLPAAIDEILRLHGPLGANRRVTRCPVTLGGRPIGAGERLSLNWISANRDGSVFDDPQAFRTDRDPSLNLLYGAGIHVCPGAPLARMELRVAMRALFEATTSIALDPSQPAPTLAVPPACGFERLPLRVR